ncbi:MAG: ATP-binding protein [Pseudomonadota bacterium]
MSLNKLMPKSISGQMMSVLGVSFALLLAILATLEYLEYDNVIETAESDFTSRRLQRLLPILDSIIPAERATYLERISHCHDGYSLSNSPYPNAQITDETQEISDSLSQALNMETNAIQVGLASLDRSDFSYSDCGSTEMNFPLDGIVVSVEIAPDQWLLAEIHPHEWHLTPTMSDWLFRSGAAFLLIGGIAFIFVRRLSKPFASLTKAATRFANSLEVTELDETGPPDVKNAIRAFNMMQRQVATDIERRSTTLAAISHDIRSPLTALRVKAELIGDEDIRADQIVSIDKMERITASALDYLKGESRNESKRKTDLGILVESECEDFREAGAIINYTCTHSIQIFCRPDALSRAIRNLIENAVKYAGEVSVLVKLFGNQAHIIIADTGPGIPENLRDEMLLPFTRLSIARESDKGGFGFGLSIVKAVVEGHDGSLTLTSNTPQGLVTTIQLPVS